MPLLNSLLERREIRKSVGICVTEDDDGNPIIQSHKSDQIKTKEQLLAASNVDTEEWEVKDYVANVWNQFSRDNGLIDLWQVKARLVRKDLSQKSVREIFESGWAEFKRGIRSDIKPPNPKKQTGTMVEISIPDLHLGKLAWDDETGHGNYDTKIACNVFRGALLDLVKRTPDAEECWFVVGNDFFNVDDRERKTSNGTPQDEDGRWQKTFREGKLLIMWAIGVLTKKFPKVKVIVMPGNHDSQRAWYLGELLQTVMEGQPNVEVDNRPLKRKYMRWGDTLIGIAHGDCLKKKDIPHLMQTEARELWGLTKRAEFHVGHLHHESVFWFGSVLCRILPSLTPPDAWHASSGYVHATKCAFANVYDKRNIVTQIIHTPEDSEYF